MKLLNNSFLLGLSFLYGLSGFSHSLAAVEAILPGGCIRDDDTSSFIRRVNQQKILAEQKAITFLLQKHKIARFSLQAGTAAVILYWVWSYSKSWFGSEQRPPAGGSAPGAPGDVAPAATENFRQWLSNAPGRAGKALITWNTWLTVGKWCAQFGTYAVASKIFSDFMTNINHSNTLSWYVRTHAPFEKVLNELKEYAQLLENPEITLADDAYAQQAFVSTANALVSDVEKVCAFMQYKLNNTSDIPIDKKQEASSIVSYVIEHTNDFVAMLVYQQGGVTLTASIDAFKDTLSREVKHFGRLDEEKDWEEEMRELSIDLNNLFAHHKALETQKKTKEPAPAQA